MNMGKFEEYKKQVEDKRKKEAEAEGNLRHGRYIESREHGKVLLRNVLVTFGIEIEFNEIDRDGIVRLPYNGNTVTVMLCETHQPDGSIEFDCPYDGTNDNKFIKCFMIIGNHAHSFVYHMSDETQFAQAIEAFAQALQGAYN